jgi:hypothetical protein
MSVSEHRAVDEAARFVAAKDEASRFVAAKDEASRFVYGTVAVAVAKS